MKKCPLQFKGNVTTFIDQHINDLYLDSSSMAYAQAEVMKALESAPVLLVRNFGNYQKSAEKFNARNSDLNFVVGDNEAVVWLWRHMYEKTPVNLTEALKQQSLPISMAPSKGEKEKNWETWGNGDVSKPDNRWRGVYGGRWKLCHIFQASPSHLNDSAESIKARFVRNFHPINHFWFVSEYNWKNHGHFHMEPSRLGEQPSVCLTFWDFYSKKYPDEAKWFVEAAQISPTELADMHLANPEISFEWKHVASISASNSSRVTQIQRIDRTTEPGIFIIKESSEGRFHLGKFGKTIAGIERNQSFKFRVVDSEGKVLAESCDVTALGLEIGNDGLGDYNKDKYRQTDFFLSLNGEDPQPHSPIARRVPGWIFF